MWSENIVTEIRKYDLRDLFLELWYPKFDLKPGLRNLRSVRTLVYVMMTSKSEQQVHLASGSPRSHKLAAQQPGGSTTTCLTSSSVITPDSPTSPRMSPVSELNLTSMPTSPSFFLASFSGTITQCY